MAELFREVLHDPPHVNIGKNGITESVVTHILELVKTKKILKIKILKETTHLFGMDAIITQLQQQCHLVILDVRGFTIIVAKKHIPGIRSPKKYNLSSDTSLTSLQESSLELATIKKSHVPSEILIVPPKISPDLSLDEATQMEGKDSTPQGASLQLNPEYIDYDNLELMTELTYLEESVQTISQSTRKTSRPRSTATQGKKQSKKTTKKTQSRDNTRT